MSSSYFNKLNYTLANEDTAMELAMLPDGARHVMAVCGSGGRSLPLLAKLPRHLSLVDLSREQLWLAEMRVEAMRLFDHDEYLAFLGYPPEPFSPKDRQENFNRLKSLSPDAKAFFKALFEAKGWNSLLYDGRWERTFAKLSHVARAFTGSRGLGLFDCKTLAEQQDYIANVFPMKRWYAGLALMGNANVFNALLYKGHFPRSNIPDSFFGYYRKAFDQLFTLGPARKNFFLQIIFHGKLRYAEGNPIECDAQIYAKCKKALESVEISYLQGNLLSEISKLDEPVDFLSFSDVPSYFIGQEEYGFMQKIRSALADNAQVVVRNYLHIPWRPDLAGFESITSVHRSSIEREKTQMYLVDVYRKMPTR